MCSCKESKSESYFMRIILIKSIIRRTDSGCLVHFERNKISQVSKSSRLNQQIAKIVKFYPAENLRMLILVEMGQFSLQVNLLECCPLLRYLALPLLQLDTLYIEKFQVLMEPYISNSEWIIWNTSPILFLYISNQVASPALTLPRGTSSQVFINTPLICIFSFQHDERFFDD